MKKTLKKKGHEKKDYLKNIINAKILYFLFYSSS